MKITCAVDEIKSLSPEELKTILDTDKTGEYLLVDVRQAEEYAAGHIPGAILIPLGELEYRQSELDRNRKIITYCRSGRRSLAAAIALCGNGFTGLHHLKGGIMNWSYDNVTGIPEPAQKFVAEAADTSDILVLAIRMEKGAMDFYGAAQREPKLVTAKSLLQMLENAEGKHMEQLYNRLGGLVGRAAVPTLDKLVENAPGNYMEGGIEINKALMKLEKKFSGELELLETGIEKEYLAYDFYKRAAPLVTDSDSRALLQELSHEERSHSSMLLGRLVRVVPAR